MDCLVVHVMVGFDKPYGPSTQTHQYGMGQGRVAPEPHTLQQRAGTDSGRTKQDAVATSKIFGKKHLVKSITPTLLYQALF